MEWLSRLDHVSQLRSSPSCTCWRTKFIFPAFSMLSLWMYDFDLKSQVWFQTKITRHKVQLPLYYIHFEIAQVQDLVSSNILLMQYWASLKLNSSILGGKNKSFGNKGCKICHMILFVFHFPPIRLVTLNKPWNLIGCFVFSVASSLAGKMMRFKAKKGAIRE